MSCDDRANPIHLIGPTPVYAAHQSAGGPCAAPRARCDMVPRSLCGLMARTYQDGYGVADEMHASAQQTLQELGGLPALPHPSSVQQAHFSASSTGAASQPPAFAPLSRLSAMPQTLLDSHLLRSSQPVFPPLHSTCGQPPVAQPLAFSQYQRTFAALPALPSTPPKTEQSDGLLTTATHDPGSDDDAHDANAGPQVSIKMESVDDGMYEMPG